MPRPKFSGKGKKSEGPRLRVRRACDRCILKKAKCDGRTTCRTCKAHNANCAYTARRGREARSYYCRMREVMEEAIQRLYWACRQGSGFPGHLPEESTEVVTTDAILRGLSLIGPADDDWAITTARSGCHASSDREIDRDFFRRPPSRVYTPSNSNLSTQSSIMPPQISHALFKSDSSPSHQPSSATSMPDYDATTCSQQQHAYDAMPMLNYDANIGTLNTSVSQAIAGYDENIEPFLNVGYFSESNKNGSSLRPWCLHTATESSCWSEHVDSPATGDGFCSDTMGC